MKSIIKGEKGELEYPCLKEHVNEYGKIVVLFIAPKTGVIVFSDSKRRGENPVGQLSGIIPDALSYNGWWGEENFTPFNGVIELSNN